MKARVGLLAIVLMALQAPHSLPSQEPQLTEQQMRDFLLTANVLKFKAANKGVTGVRRLTLSDGNITHDASFQPIDQAKLVMEFADGRREFNFHDSYKYNIAAYELALLLGLGDMMPVTVARKWSGKVGSLSWWLPAKMDESQRLKQKIQPPEQESWNKQMHRVRVFVQLIYDTDRNLGNVLISANWHIWMIDFTRAFRINRSLENAKNLEKCDRQLLENMRRLDAKELVEKTKGYLTAQEVLGVMARRDLIIAWFERLIKEKGESEVLY